MQRHLFYKVHQTKQYFQNARQMTSSEFQNSPSQQQASVTNIRLMGLDSAKTEYALLVKFTALLSQAKTQTRSQPTPWSKHLCFRSAQCPDLLHISERLIVCLVFNRVDYKISSDCQKDPHNEGIIYHPLLV